MKGNSIVEFLFIGQPFHNTLLSVCFVCLLGLPLPSSLDISVHRFILSFRPGDNSARQQRRGPDCTLQDHQCQVCIHQCGFQSGHPATRLHQTVEVLQPAPWLVHVPGLETQPCWGKLQVTESQFHSCLSLVFCLFVSISFLLYFLYINSFRVFVYIIFPMLYRFISVLCSSVAVCLCVSSAFCVCPLIQCLSVRERDRETDTERDTDRQTDGDRERKSERDTERDTDRQTESDTDRQTNRDREVSGSEQKHSLSKARVKHGRAWSPNRWVTDNLCARLCAALRFLRSQILCRFHKSFG